MAISGQANYSVDRDGIITRALRIVNEIGTGEVPNSTRIDECSDVLNQILKEWIAYGMQLWKIATFEVPLVSGQAIYVLPDEAPELNYAPNKILHGYARHIVNETDSPLVLLTKQEYNQFGSKFQTGSVTQFYYNTPGPDAISSTSGQVYVIQPPTATYATDYSIYFTGVFPLEDIDEESIIDVPSYYYNALVWALADQLAYESGVPVAMLDRISRKAEYHRNIALSGDIEEGALYLQPDWQSMYGDWN